MAIEVLKSKDKKKRRIGVIEYIIGIVALGISIGLFLNTDKYAYALSTFTLLAAIYMIINARTQWL
jgi:hypothetical protein